MGVLPAAELCNLLSILLRESVITTLVTVSLFFCEMDEGSQRSLLLFGVRVSVGCGVISWRDGGGWQRIYRGKADI